MFHLSSHPFWSLALGLIVLPARLYAANADLSIPVHSHDPAQPASNSYITYSFTIHNNSTTDAASNVTVTVAGTGSQFFDSGNPYFFVNNGDGTFTATVGTVAAGADAGFTVKYFAQTGPVSVTATVSSPDDPNSLNNSATESTIAGSGTPTADLEMVSVTVVPNPAKVGDLRHYHGTVTNNGPDDATDVQVAIEADSVDSHGIGYDAHETFDHSIPAPNPPGADGNGYRYLPMGDIPAGGTVNFDAYYDAIAEGSFGRDFFLDLSGAQIDPDLNNNNVLVSSTINGAGSATADLSAIVTAATTAPVGANVGYKFHVLNSGPDTATGVTLSFKPASTQAFVSSTVPYTVDTSGPSAGYYFVSIADLPSGATADFTFVFQVVKAGSATLSGDVFSDVQDSEATNNNFAATITVAAQVPPTNGGLSATALTVNGSAQPVTGLTDTVLRFAATQTGTPGGLGVRVQYSTVPGNPEPSWTDFNDGSSGHMTYDTVTKQFVLNSLNYPAVNGVSFRAISSASAYQPDSISNKVGPFNLASTKPRQTPPTLILTGNGPFADLYFRAFFATAPGGVTLRVQRSATPATESSWVDLPNGQMLPSDDPTRYYLMANNLDAGSTVYFRALEVKSNFADGISRPNGPFSLTKDTPPTVTLVPPAALPGSGTGDDIDHPILVQQGTLHLTASASAPSGIATIKLLYDGSTIDSRNSATITTDYTTNVVGNHLIEAIAIDKLGGTSRYGTQPIHIRIVSTTDAAIKGESVGGGSRSRAATAPGKVFTVAKSGGNWNDPSTWKDASGKAGVPGEDDTAIIGASTVRCPFDVVIGSVTLSGGTIIGPGAFDVTKIITISAGTFQNSVLDTLFDDSVCELLSNADVQFSGTVINHGKFNVHGGGGISGLTQFVNYGTTNFQTPLNVPPDAGKNPAQDTRTIAAMNVTSSGLITSDLRNHLLADGSGLISQDGNGLIGQDGNGFTDGGAQIVGQGGGNLVNTNGSNLVNTNGSNIVGQGGGNIVGQGGGNSPQGQDAAETTVSGFVQDGGETNLDGISLTGQVTLNSGVLAGSGIIYGDLVNNGGYISPGHSPGGLGVAGNFVQGADGTIILEDGGATPGQFDQLLVAGAATLGGHLDVKLINGYQPTKADTFSPLSYASHSGAFATVSANGTASLNATGLLATVDPAQAAPKSGQAVNISTRAQVQTGDDVVIGGFIVSGPAGSTKKVVLRGIGPSLAAAGISGALSDPYLELYSGPTQLTSNDNWKSDQAAIQATGLAPSNDLESAIVTTLAPGAYTVILHGSHGEAGVGLVEIYDLDTTSAAALVNISTRCKVETGDDVMIGGFILQGDEPADVLVRALGPSLSDANVSDALSDPVMELHDANGAVITDNDWRETQEPEITATTIPPANDRESAIRVTLPPGAYTAIVRGNDDVTGVALVEVYLLD